MSTHHKQVAIRLGERRASVDARLAPLIRELWRTDIDTFMSCQRHSATGKVWIGFTSGADAERFLDVVLGAAPTAWARREQWYFGQYESAAAPLTSGGQAAHPTGWEFHASVYDYSRHPDGPAGPAFGVCVNVLFPPSDLKHVVKQVRQFNARTKKARRG